MSRARFDEHVDVLIRCDGDSAVGLGHVVRCLALAHELRDTYKRSVSFAMASGEPGIKLVREAGFPCELKDEQNESHWVGTLIERYRVQVLVLDVRSALATDEFGDWKKKGVLIASIDDPSPRRMAADLVFYPPIPQVEEYDWSGFEGELCRGWEWVLLRRQFSVRYAPRESSPPVVLVTMGGSDPANFTTRALACLDCLKGDFEVVVVLGAGFAHEEKLREFLAGAKRAYTLERNVGDMASLMRRADLAVASFGVTAYELAAVGVPAVYFCLSDDHARSASKFVESGFGFICGAPGADIEPCLAEKVRKLIDTPSLRHEMGRRACDAVDGKGAARISSKIIDVLERKGPANE